MNDFKLKERSWVGRPVLRFDRGYSEYGVIIGWHKDNLFRVHFANEFMTRIINSADLYIPFIKPSVSVS